MAFVFDHIHLRCSDLEGAVDFYGRMFGGEVVARMEAGGRRIARMTVGSCTLALSPKDEGTEIEPLMKGPSWGLFQIAFRVDDLDAAVAELKAKGAVFKSAPAQLAPHVRAVFMDAPDGVEIELVQFL